MGDRLLDLISFCNKTHVKTISWAPYNIDPTFKEKLYFYLSTYILILE